MADPRFFRRFGPFSIGEIAKRVGGQLSDRDAAAMTIEDIATLNTAAAGELSYYGDPRYLADLAETKASAVVIGAELAHHAPAGRCCIVVADPRLAFAQIGHLFYPAPMLEPGIDPSARVDPRATLGTGTRVDAGAVIGPGARIGARCHIGWNAIIGPGVVLGDDGRVGANAVITHALVGDRVAIDTGVRIGGQGFGFVPTETGLLRMLQLGRVIIEDGVEIGANSAVDRGATGDTVVGAGTVIDNLVQVGHNVRLGRNCVISGQAGIAGSTTIGDGVLIGGQVAVSDHITIGAGARIAFNSAVIRDVKPGTTVGGYPAIDIRQWHRQTVQLARTSRGNPDDAA
jgi:UDP-3-O-[3-hydroxymyristoyl] glucosamine N-acyltransferase